jgi:hypothetical protein
MIEWEEFHKFSTDVRPAESSGPHEQVLPQEYVMVKA